MMPFFSCHDNKSSRLFSMTQIGLQPILKWGKERRDRTAMNYYSSFKKKLSMIDSAFESISKDYYIFGAFSGNFNKRSVIKTIIYLQIFNYLRLLCNLKSNFSLSLKEVQCKVDGCKKRCGECFEGIEVLT